MFAPEGGRNCSSPSRSPNPNSRTHTGRPRIGLKLPFQLCSNRREGLECENPGALCRHEKRVIADIRADIEERQLPMLRATQGVRKIGE